MGVTVDFLLASSAPLTEGERQSGTGRWTQVIQNMAEVTLKTDTTVSNTKRMIIKTCYLLSITLLRFSNYLVLPMQSFQHQETQALQDGLLSGIFHELFPLKCILLPTTKGTRAPNYSAKATWEIQNWSQDYTRWVSYSISQLQEYYIFPGVLERCNKQKLSSLLKKHKIHVCTLLPLQMYSLDLLEELATRALPNLFQSK